MNTHNLPAKLACSLFMLQQVGEYPIQATWCSKKQPGKLEKTLAWNWKCSWRISSQRILVRTGAATSQIFSAAQISCRESFRLVFLLLSTLAGGLLLRRKLSEISANHLGVYSRCIMGGWSRKMQVTNRRATSLFG